jgi:hypothetical protein
LGVVNVKILSFRIVMETGEIFKVHRNADWRTRLRAMLVFGSAVAFFWFFWAADNDRIKSYRYLEPCGFQQKYKLPCPTCGFTRSIMAFSGGNVLKSFYIQPAAGVFCLSIAIIGVFALLIGLFGLNFGLVEFLKSRVKFGYLILIILVVLAGGWAVMFARALVNF